jgi:hypothetical protein
MANMQAAIHAKEMTKEILKGLSGINGIGITWDEQGKPCVKVNIDYEMSTESRKKIPSLVDGVPVVVEEIGNIQTE